MAMQVAYSDQEAGMLVEEMLVVKRYGRRRYEMASLVGLHLRTSYWLVGFWAGTALAVVDMLQAAGSSYLDTLDCFASFEVGMVRAAGGGR